MNDIIEHLEEAKSLFELDTDGDNDDGDLQSIDLLVTPIRFRKIMSTTLWSLLDLKSLLENHSFSPQEVQRCFDDIRPLQSAMKRGGLSLLHQIIENSRQLALLDSFCSH